MELYPIKCAFQQCVDHVNIAGCFSARRRETKGGVGKRAVFQQNVPISRKQWEICPKLLLMTNRKLHMRFQLAPLMTLNSCRFDFL